MLLLATTKKKRRKLRVCRLLSFIVFLWYRSTADGTYSMTINGSVVAGLPYAFTFAVTNPSTAQVCFDLIKTEIHRDRQAERQRESEIERHIYRERAT